MLLSQRNQTKKYPFKIRKSMLMFINFFGNFYLSLLEKVIVRLKIFKWLFTNICHTEHVIFDTAAESNISIQE